MKWILIVIWFCSQQDRDSLIFYLSEQIFDDKINKWTLNRLIVPN